MHARDNKQIRLNALVSIKYALSQFFTIAFFNTKKSWMKQHLVRTSAH